jgi:signal transduction histidine kinase
LAHRIALSGNDEFVAVANSMNAMATELADHRAREVQVRLDLEKQVAARTVELSTALTSLRDAEIRRRRLFADVSHELRTPTTAIRGEAQVTLRGGEKSPEEYCASLRRIEDTSRQLGRAIDDLLSMARSDIDALSLQHEPVDLALVLDEVRANGDAIGRAAGVTIECEPWPAHLSMLGDANRLRQLLLAILDNAIHYSHPGQTVRLWARRNDHGPSSVEVHIADQGIGIEPEELSLVFNRGHRAANAVRHRSDGSGFGLPIANVLARGHGGEISISSEVEKGTTVIVKLPLTKDQVETAT